MQPDDQLTNKLVTLAITTLLVVGTAQAADKYWANTGIDYNAAGSWTDGSVPGSSDIVWFDTDAVTQPYVTTSLTNNGLRFATNPNANPATTAGSCYTLTGPAGVKLMLTAAGGADSYYPLIQKTTGTNVIAVDLQLTATTLDRRFDTRAGTLEISGSISSVDDEMFVYYSSSGTVFKLSGNNTFTGSFSHTGVGTLMIASVNALSTATIILGQHGDTGTLYSFLDNVTGTPLTLAGNNPVKLISGKGLSFIGTHSLNFGTGTVTFSDTDPSRNCPIVVQNARLTFGGPVGETNASHGFQKLGPGTLELRAASSYSAATYVSGGVLLLNHPDALGISNLVLRGISGYAGVLGLGTSDFTRSVGTGAGQVQWASPGGYTASGGFAAYNASRIVNLGGASVALTWGGAGFVGATFVLGASDADAMVDFQNPISLGGFARTIQVDDGSADIDGRLSGEITSSSSSGGITKTGVGTLELTATNSFTGPTTINNGRLLVNGVIAGGAVTVNTNGALGGSGSVGGKMTVYGTLTPGGTQSGTLTLTNSLTLLSGSTIRFDLGASNDLVRFNGFSQVLSNSPAGNIHWVLIPGAGFQMPSTCVLLDWSAAASFNKSGLTTNNFIVDNTNMVSSFRITASTLELDLRPIPPVSTLLMIQ